MERLNYKRSFRLSPADISAAILAGGDASRFGGKMKVKALIGGDMIIQRAIGTLRKVFDEIIIVTNSPEEFSTFTGCLVTGDIFQGYGPLAGIHAAMKKSTRKAIFAVAGDMPFLDEELIKKQIAMAEAHHSDAVIPELNGMREPLHGLYMKRVETLIEKSLEEGKQLALLSLLDRIETVYFKLSKSEEHRKIFININSKEDIEKYK